MMVKQRAALVAAAFGILSMSVALPGLAATCVDAKGKKYDCKVSNIKPAAPPQSVLQQQAKPALAQPSAGAVKGAQPSLIQNNGKPASGIVAQGGGNAVAKPGAGIISTNGGGIVAQGGGNLKNK